MSFEEWLYRKAEQNAHNEILAFLMMALGMNLLVGGLIVTIFTVGEPILIPFITQQPLSPSATVGLILTIAGFFILSIGFILVVHYDKEMSWYIRETEKSTLYRKRKAAVKTTSRILEEYYDKEKEDR